MRLGRRVAVLLLVLAPLALAAGGCGDDDGEEITVPSISIPTETAPETAQPPTTPDPSGGTGTPDPDQPDSPENDVPPPEGSPQEAFETFCKQNPEACG